MADVVSVLGGMLQPNITLHIYCYLEEDPLRASWAATQKRGLLGKAG
jgi:hypothetical protein